MQAWFKQGKELRSMVPILATYLGHVDLKSTEEYLSMVSQRFLKHLSRLRTSAQLVPVVPVSSKASLSNVRHLRRALCEATP